MVSAIAFTLVVLAGLGYFAWQMYGRFGLILASQGMPTFDRLPERVNAVLVYFFGQQKFIRSEVGIVKERTAGWLHFFVFWGFTILGIQVVQMFARAWAPDFYLFPFGPDLLGKPYMLVRDVFELIVIACVAILLARWLVIHPARLFGYAPAENRQRSHAHWEAYLILAFIGMICAAGLVYDAGRIIRHEGSPAPFLWYEPVSSLVAKILGDAAVPAGNVAWWVHNLVVLTFLNFLPLAKHFHVITSLPNVFWSKLEPLGQMSKPEYDENTVRYGTSRIDHFTWKQVLDMFSCTECGRCSSQCPATATGKPLAPRQLLLDLRDYMYKHQEEIHQKRVGKPGNGEALEEIGENIVGPVIEDEVLWSCNMCRACEESCPVMIEYVDKIVDMRRHLVQEEARFPEELTRVFKAMETQSNPWGVGAAKRFEWADGMDVPTVADKPDAEYLYYVGCAGAFDDRNKKTTQAFTRILKKAGIDFACLANEEPCNGDSARRLGNEYLYQAMAQTAVETFNGYNVKKIIVNCPHCFNTIKNEFTQFGGTYEVIHAAELVRQLIASGKIEMNGGYDKRTVYHDSCYYGRFNDVYDEPREVLAKAGATVEEVPHRHHNFGRCCGAGGGRMWLEERADQRVNVLRTEEALQANPEAIAVSCPFCMTMMSDGIKAKDLEERVQTLDVMEIVDRAMK